MTNKGRADERMTKRPQFKMRCVMEVSLKLYKKFRCHLILVSTYLFFGNNLVNVGILYRPTMLVTRR